MGAIQYLFSALIRLAIALFVVAIVWWLVSALYPTLNAKNLFSTAGEKSAQGWLPAPKDGLFSSVKAPTETDNLYVHGEPFNGYANAYNNNIGGSEVDFITYTSTGEQVITRMGGSEGSSARSRDPNILYIRNLSIYQGGHLYTGLTFTGEARDVMFRNGRFPIIIIDSSNRVVNVLYGEAISGASILGGWTRFQAKIVGVLPNRTPCAMIFEQALIQSQYTYSNTTIEEPIRVAIPVQCN